MDYSTTILGCHFVCDSDQKEAILDFAESKLKQEINDGNITAIIFFLKTKGKIRGYVEKEQEKGKDSDTSIEDRIKEKMRAHGLD